MSSEIDFQFAKNPGSIIKVIGVGGGGGNAVNHMFHQGIKDVDFMVCNTDAQALANSPVPLKIQLGASLTEGRGAGNKPEMGRQAAIENIEDVRKKLLANTKMVFITAGMGGGTGTGAAPEIAKICHEMGILTIGIVTIPFRNEGRRRIRQAVEGIKELEGNVDSLLVINNERIREMYGDFPISEAFAKADNVLATAAKGIAEIITVPGYINVDFADVETVMRESGVALMGTGIAEGEGRCLVAVEEALNSPLLNNNDITGSKNILLNVTSGNSEITMDEIGEITDFIQDKAGYEADLIWGNGIDEALEDKISVTVIATGFSMSNIPEMLMTKKVEKERHFLVDDFAKVTPHKKVQAPENKNPEPTKQRSIEFDVTGQHVVQNEFDAMYPNTSRERAEKDYGYKMQVDFTNMSDADLDEIEEIPAYKRKKLNMKKDRQQPDVSSFRMSKGDEDSPIQFRENRYLHEKPD
ncbi:MAG: cell division protein FtsZ [Prolixibacteraceae bacterium]|nr:cell division protein FtsZ [Prolixibacteraceae bacterium]